jgi:hypothetical protein
MAVEDRYTMSKLSGPAAATATAAAENRQSGMPRANSQGRRPRWSRRWGDRHTMGKQSAPANAARRAAEYITLRFVRESDLREK